MRKNEIFLEDKIPFYKKIINNENNKKLIPILYIFFLIAFTLLILNLLFTKKLLDNQKNQYIPFKKKEMDIKYKKIKINTSLETFDLNIFKKIKNEIKDYVELLPEEQMFFYGLIRAFKPRKIVEIGVSRGGSSSLILNAIEDINDAKLFSIDYSKNCYKDKSKKTGYLVKEKFPKLMNKWNLYTGGLTYKFIETIGNGIDLAFIDTMHITPGEMLDWLMVLPFLNNEAIVVFHDTFISYAKKRISKRKKHTSNNQLLCYIRGDLILPQYGESIFFRNIGALKLAPDQSKYYYQYFLALGIQWEYMPKEKELRSMRDFFMKYYGEKYVEIYADAVEKNKIYLNKNKNLK